MSDPLSTDDQASDPGASSGEPSANSGQTSDPGATRGQASDPGATSGQPSERPARNLPPITERELRARARGLSSAYIEGGDDPDLDATRRKEARYVRLLLGMVALIVGISIVVTLVGLVVAGPAR